MDFSVGKFVSKDRMINPNSMNQAVTLEPIGTVVSGRTEIEDDNWGSVISVIQLDNQFSPEVTAGLSDFSHIEVIYFMHGVNEICIEKRRDIHAIIRLGHW